MANPIVNVVVSQEIAPAPSTLQKTGALVSQGATITTPGAKSLLTQLSDLTPLLTGAKAIASINWVTGNGQVTTVQPHGFEIGDVIPMTIAGVVPTGYNATALATITGASTFNYPLASSPGVVTTQGVYTPEDVTELVQQATTFFAQGSAQSVYVLEIGAGSTADGVAFLAPWIAANPNQFYGYLVPRTWDGDAAYLSFLANYQNTGSKVYFWTTTTLQTYAAYAGMKDVVAMVEAPAYGVWPANALTSASWLSGTATALTTSAHGVQPGQWFQLAGNSPTAWNGWFLAGPGTTGSTLVFGIATNPGANSVLGTLVESQYASVGVGANEFSLAAEFRVTLNYSPSSTNKVTPLNYGFLFGVTPFPTQGNNALLTTLLAANVNLVGTGAQGGISNSLVLGGKMMDGNPFKYWYSIDNIQINLARNVTAALIDGANNPQNPVDYDQPGINTLQQASVTTMATGIANGLVLNPIRAPTLSAPDLQNAIAAGTFAGTTLVNAEPFGAYTTENPNDYPAGIYNGISVRYAPLRGFEDITINVTASSFAQ